MEVAVSGGTDNTVGGRHGAEGWTDVPASESLNLYMKREEGEVEEDAVEDVCGVFSLSMNWNVPFVCRWRFYNHFYYSRYYSNLQYSTLQ
jgi:hypothetical protein